MKYRQLLKSTVAIPTAKFLYDIFLVYVCYTLCRFAFIIKNLSVFNDSFSSSSFWRLMHGGWLFDTSAILYSNALFLLIFLLPLHYKEKPIVAKIEKLIFVVVNSLFLIANLCDCVYFEFTHQRTTTMVFSQFANENNLLGIFGVEMLNNWYLVLLAAAMIFGLWKLYANPMGIPTSWSLKKYYIRRSIALLIITPLTICGMRGAWFHTATRPIATANAHEFVDDPSKAGFVLNTTFTLLRTSTRKIIEVPKFYASTDELRRVYSPIHTPADSVIPDKRNVVILIVESFAEEFVGARNRNLDNGTYRGYTEFTDSLLQHSLTFDHTYCNGWISIDAMPAVLASLPKMYHPFILSPFTLNDISGIGTLLGDWGYNSAFFHGGDNSSMGFQAVARACGFKDYFGRTEYEADKRFGGSADFDGHWGIWDEEFLQFYALKMSEMQQPFVTSAFTLSSHHPFKIPERYANRFKDEGLHQLHKCIRYTDNALRRFFDTARQQPWFNNTIFIITADHASSKVTHDEYKTEEGHFRVPIIIYDPSGKTATGNLPGIMQHIDIVPTVLGILGYDKPFYAFGKDMLATPADSTWAMNYHNIPQYIYGDYILQLDDNFNIMALYDLKSDPLMKNNIKGTVPETENSMYSHLKAILQTYDDDMRTNHVRIK